MNLGFDWKGGLDLLPQSLDRLTARINTIWKKEHKVDGTHGAITADSIEVAGDAVINGDLTVNGDLATFAHDVSILDDLAIAQDLTVGGVADVTGSIIARTDVNLLGGSIIFPATQVPAAGANTLDDYEEGITNESWTPSLLFGGAATGMTYTSRGGTYVKVGRTVTVHWDFILSAKGASVGNATITGLPFTQASSGGHIPVGSALKGAVAAGFVGNCIPWLAADVINLYQSAASGDVPVADAVFTNTTRIFGTLTYFASA